jgi:hypothetical protein
VNYLSRGLIVLGMTLLSTPAWAGMDDMQTIVQITGVVEVRGNFVRGAKPLETTRWIAAKVGDDLSPGCSVRTGAQSTVLLRRGDASYHPQKGDRVSYTILQPRTLILLHSQYQSKKKLIEVKQGKIVREEKRI